MTQERLCKTRKEAKDAGAKKYRTGKVCKNRHMSFRYTSSGVCVECDKQYKRTRKYIMSKKEVGNYKLWRSMRLGTPLLLNPRQVVNYTMGA